MTTVSKAPAPPQVRPRWPLWARLTASLLVTLHVAAVFMPPFAFETSPMRGYGSPLAESLMRLLQPYIDAAYLNHGYAFFAPNPGPSHLLRARLEFADGRPPMELTLPDLERHWPRLLYHRHFMLSEHLSASFLPPQPPREMPGDPAALDSWRRARGMYTARRAAIENHLRVKYGASAVRLSRVEHRLLDPVEVTQLRKQLDDADTYRALSENGSPEETP